MQAPQLGDRFSFVHCLEKIHSEGDANFCFAQQGHLELIRQMLSVRKTELICSNEALRRLKKGCASASQFLVLADEVSYDSSAKHLINQGAKPFLISSGESPCIATRFYRNFPSITTQYKFRMLFKHFDAQLGGFIFPSFSLAERPAFEPLSGRKFAVMVSANKFPRTVSGLHLWKPRKLCSWVAGKFNMYPDPFTRSIRKRMLYDARLEVLLAFRPTTELDLYGSGWDDLRNLPRAWRSSLAGKLRPLGRCSDKKSIISNYKFCFAIENCGFPSYLTEKIIDAIRAGCVPVYLGDPEVCKTIPKDCFVDMRDFSSAHSLKLRLQSISDAEAEAYVRRAQEWLFTRPEGRKFSFESFAERFVATCADPFLTEQRKQ